jgi:hypothetical protein
MAKQIRPVIKPFMRGSWHGKIAVRKGARMILSILFIAFLYFLLGLMLSFDSLAMRAITSFALVAFAASYMYFQGASNGEADTAIAEIMYQHDKDGQAIDPIDRERCFHPGKGFFEIFIALIPYLILTLAFAVLAKPLYYSLGVLPSWVDTPAQQTHVSEALAYYAVTDSSVFMAILRIIARSVTMPFINVSLLLGTNAVLWAERLTPLWVSLAPLAYGFGYLQGPNMRIKVNTGIKIGVHNKKRKERKARKTRFENNKPQQLI